MGSNDTTPVGFTQPELWLLHEYIRHELPDRDKWHFPPADLELNEEIARCILLCEGGEDGAYIALTHGDCLLIDFHIRAGMKDPNGNPVGRSILVKTFMARERLLGRDDSPYAEEPEAPTVAEIATLVSQMEGD